MPSQAMPTPYTMRMPGRNRSRARPSGMPNTTNAAGTRGSTPARQVVMPNKNSPSAYRPKARNTHASSGGGM
jgi:hypothetical protein